MVKAPEQPILLVKDLESWHEWLECNDSSSDGVWLTLSKAGNTELTSLKYQEALEEALCSGWIDGQRKGLNDVSFLQRFTPRRKTSVWSLRNVELIAELSENGRLRMRGEEEVAKAKADGRWERAYPGAKSFVAPEDLVNAVETNAAAAKAYADLNSQERYALALPIITAKNLEFRAKRIESAVKRLAISIS